MDYKYASILVFVLCVMLLFVNPASATWYDGSWGYKVDIATSSTGNANINISTGSGSNTGTTIFCNSHCKSDLSDIRVTLDDTTALPFWIERDLITANTYRIWINKTSAGVINVYYGNSGATSIENGDATFPLFDNFIGSTINSAKWTSVGATQVVGGGTVVVSSSATGNYLQSIQTFGYGYKWVTNSEFIMYKSGTDESEWVWGFHGGTQYALLTTGLTSPLDSYQILTKNSAGAQNWLNLGVVTGDKYNTWSIGKSSSVMDFYLNDTLLTSTSAGMAAAAMPVKYENDATRAGHDTVIDWVFVSKYPELVKSSVSSETTSGGSPTPTPTPTLGGTTISKSSNAVIRAGGFDPTLAMASNGNYLLATAIDANTLGTRVLKISSNSGTSWGSDTALSLSPSTQINTLIKYPDNSIQILGHYPWHQPEMIKSTDNGASWSSVTSLTLLAGAQSVTNLGNRPETIGSFVYLPIQIVPAANANYRWVGIAYTGDNGNTWSYIDAPRGADTDVAAEPTMAYLGGNRIIMFWRYDTSISDENLLTPAKVYGTINPSTGAITWESGRVLDTYFSGAVDPEMMYMSDYNELILVSAYTTPGGGSRTRKVFVSDDQGATWNTGKEITLVSSATNGVGYGALMKMDSSHLYSVHFDGTNLVSSVLTLSGSSPTPTPAPTPTPTLGGTTISKSSNAVIRAGGFDPTLAMASNGNYLLATAIDANTIGSRILKISSNTGTSWGGDVSLSLAPSTMVNTLVKYPDNSIQILGHYPWHQPEMIKSTDNGASWSSVTSLTLLAGAQSVTNLGNRPETIGSFVYLPIQIVPAANANYRWVGIAYTGDNGNTWSYIDAPRGADTDVAAEPTMAYLGGNRIIMFWRYDTSISDENLLTPAKVYGTINPSTGAITWESGRVLDTYFSGAVDPEMMYMSDYNELVLVNAYNSGGGARTRKVYVSDDQGATWNTGKEITLVSSSTNGIAYSALLKMDASRIYSVHFDGTNLVSSILTLSGSGSPTPTPAPTSTPTPAPTATPAPNQVNIQIVSIPSNGGTVLSSTLENAQGQRSSITFLKGEDLNLAASPDGTNVFWKYSVGGVTTYDPALTLTNVQNSGTVTAYFNVTPISTSPPINLTTCDNGTAYCIFIKGIDGLSAAIGSIGTNIGNAIMMFVNAFNNIATGIMGFPQAITNIANAFENMSIAFEHMGNSLNGGLTNISHGMQNQSVNITQGALNGLNGLGGSIVNTSKAVSQGTMSFLDIPQQIYGIVYVFLKPIIDLLTAVIKTMQEGLTKVNNLVSAITQLGSAILDFLNGAFDAVKGGY